MPGVANEARQHDLTALAADTLAAHRPACDAFVAALGAHGELDETEILALWQDRPVETV